MVSELDLYRAIKTGDSKFSSLHRPSVIVVKVGSVIEHGLHDHGRWAALGRIMSAADHVVETHSIVGRFPNGFGGLQPVTIFRAGRW